MNTDHPLVGGWRLRAWVSIDVEGAETEPLGDRPDGLLSYTADGSMLAIMGRADRPRFVSGDPARIRWRERPGQPDRGAM
jgi:hypothetical protein